MAITILKYAKLYLLYRNANFVIIIGNFSQLTVTIVIFSFSLFFSSNLTRQFAHFAEWPRSIVARQISSRLINFSAPISTFSVKNSSHFVSFDSWFLSF